LDRNGCHWVEQYFSLNEVIAIWSDLPVPTKSSVSYHVKLIATMYSKLRSTIVLIFDSWINNTIFIFVLKITQLQDNYIHNETYLNWTLKETNSCLIRTWNEVHVWKNMNADREHHCKRFERSFFLHFSDNLADVFDFLTLQDMHNMPALSINIKISCTDEVHVLEILLI
jgi:hypothetical protein